MNSNFQSQFERQKSDTVHSERKGSFIIMRQYVFGALCSGLVLVTTLFFNNCAQTSQGNLFDVQSLTCEGPSCANLTKQDMLEVKVNQPETFWVSAYEEKVNVGGDCNEGGYDKSVVTWRLFQDDIPLMNSESRFETTGDATYEAECVNGRFSLLVDFMDADGLVRTGLGVGQWYLEHRLEVEIFGIETDDQGVETRVSNPAQAPEVVILQPLCIDRTSC